MKTSKTWEDVEVGDVVRHPTDKDIGVVLDIHTHPEGDKFYSIHWMKDGLLHLMRYTPLEILTDTFCPGDISLA